MIIRILTISLVFFLSLPLPAFAQANNGINSRVVITPNVTNPRSSSNCMEKVEISSAGPLVFSVDDGGNQDASCDGIFCSCTGPANSPDCRRITGCIDDILCLRDDCGCIGGSVD